jgi:hypothetical protein
MRWWLCTGLLLLGLAARPAAAQEFLPGNFAGWQAVAGSAVTGAPLEQLAGDDAGLLRACRELGAERQSYQRDGETLTVTLYRLGDPSYAYSAYSFLRPVPATDLRPTPHASVGPDRAMLLIGNFLVDVSGKHLPVSAKDLGTLAAALKPHASDIPYPTLWQYLPTGHLTPHSDRYALDPGTLAAALQTPGTEMKGGGAKAAAATGWVGGDWLGFDDDVEAEVAHYDLAGRHVTLVLASYPTQQLAAEHVKTFPKWYEVNPVGKAEGSRPALYVRRYSSMVGLVSGAKDAAQAQKLLSQIRYQTVVTWNEPGFKLKDLTMPEYLVGIIFGTVAIIMITLVSGIALGMIRVGVKHFLPGVVFDRRRSVEIIQLGLSSKPINSGDFYSP